MSCSLIYKNDKEVIVIKTIFVILVVFAVCMFAYYGVIKLIRIWTGCSSNEAVAKLQRFINGIPDYKFEADLGLQNEIWENVKKVIGDKRYQQLVALSTTAISTPMFFAGVEGTLPYIGVSLYYADDNEKRILENLIVNVARKYLQIYGYDTAILVEWRERYDLDMPFLQIRYARNDGERKALAIGIRNQRRVITMQNSTITDDTEDRLDE